MRFFVLFLSLFIFLLSADAQRIRVNGDVRTHADIPIQGVLVMAFENSTMLKSYVSDEKGQYSFNVDRVRFDILFFKPGMHAHTYSLNNQLNKETQGMYVFIQMDDSLAETAVDMNKWLKQHHLTASYMDSVYTEEMRKQSLIPEKKKTKKQIDREAKAEQRRFSNYKETTSKQSIDNQESDVTTVTIGPDTYELITNDKGGKKYFKNSKPITEATYKFETTRRYEGVLKNSKNVRKFDKYKPLEHVKG